MRCDFCNTRMPRNSERCGDCGAVNSSHGPKSSAVGARHSRAQAVGSFKERYPQTWPQLAGLFGAGIGFLLFGIGLSFVSAGMGIFFVVIGMCVAGIGAGLLFAVESKRKLMCALGVDADSHKAFERERKDKQAKKFNFGNIVITENWVYHERLVLGSVLLPLGEVLRLEREHEHHRYVSAFSVRLRFKEYRSHKLPCDFEELERLMAVLAERCSNASVE